MICREHVLVAVLSLGTVVFNLFSPAGGYALVVGDSMDPTIPAGCTLVSAEPWDGESSLEGEIVAYQSDDIAYEFTGVSRLDATFPVAHRVVAEYESYELDDANHSVTPDGLFVVESGSNTTFMASKQTHSDATALEGEHVLVLKGDNNEWIDRALVPADDVRGALDPNARLAVRGNESWPCRGTGIGPATG